MLDEKLILKLNENILKRYEETVGEGILFLYDVKQNEYWMGNRATKDLIRMIDGEKTLKEIYTNLLPIFSGCQYDELKQSFDTIISELLDLNFLILATGKNVYELKK